MADLRARPGVRKKASLKLGRRTIRFDVGSDRELFTIHEELICVAPYFRSILQPRRKAIGGDCSICQEPLDPDTKELTYCSASCGNNFHFACIEDWHGHTPDHETSKCPLCRQDWAYAEPWGGVHELSTINAAGFEIYTAWLYTSRIDSSLDGHALLDAYFLGARFYDRAFCRSVLSAIIARFILINRLPPAGFVQEVYDATYAHHELRKLMVGLFTETTKELIRRSLTKACTKPYPPLFIQDLVMALADKRAAQGTFNRASLTARLLPRT